MIKSDLIEVCIRYNLPKNINVVIREAYIPYIPNNWDGLLVLGEAQNLSKTYLSYVNKLKSVSVEDKICRLKDPDSLGVMPWDDGSLKIALIATMKINPNQTAISNAVLWSQSFSGERNKTPTEPIIKHSVILWKKLLPILNPSKIVVSGSVANKVIRRTEWQGTLINIIHPGRMRFIKKEMSETSLLEFHPKVKQTVEKYSYLIKGSMQNTIRFACHIDRMLNSGDDGE